MKRKYFIALFAIVTFLTSCQPQNKNKTESKDLSLIATLGGIIYLDTTSTIHIATTLFNSTKDTIDFVTMTCSYEDMFLTDTSIFKVHSRYDCYGNYPTVISIPPGSKLDQFIMVKPVSRDVKMDHKLKIGMYMLIPKIENGFKGIINQYDSRQTAKVIWSNELDLKRLYRKVYK